ncbi:MAG: prephenate dehydrogenase [Spirochaetales bacterium]|nr:MAG: prephenate dehydrogenase [Spirochaetales bacterium]
MVVGVYGLGRFGAFWAQHLAEHFTVTGWSRSSERPTPPGVRRVEEKEVLQADVLVLCVAISSLEEVLRRIAGQLRPNTLVMDTCSVKMYPVRLMKEILPPEVEILATHPMFGPDSGSRGLKDLPLVFSPVRMADESAAAWQERFCKMGLSVLPLSPEEHDREASITQGITHFIGRVLGELELNESNMATSGYRSLLDIVRQTCNDPWSLFVDLQKYNPYTVQMRRDVHQAITVMLERFDSIEAINNGRKNG